MTEAEKDPIRIRMTEALDPRLAGFYFSSDNSPRDPDNSISINGRVEFGERHQSADGRRYKIGVRGAFLEVTAMQCTFDINLKLQDQPQAGVFAESRRANTSKTSKAHLKGAAKGQLSGTSPDASANGSAGISLGQSNAAETRSEQKYQIYRVRWLAGGWRLGDPKYGDPYEQDGVLRGAYLNGNWGRLVPHCGETQYGSRFTLLVQKGSLFVERLDPSVRDRFPLQRSPEDCAFEALKNEVSAWFVESQLTGPANGFDKEREELVLAQGEVSVNLAAFESTGVEEKSGKLVEAPTTLALPPPETALPAGAQTVAKRKRAQKPVQKNG